MIQRAFFIFIFLNALDSIESLLLQLQNKKSNILILEYNRGLLPSFNGISDYETKAKKPGNLNLATALVALDQTFPKFA